MSSDQPHSQVRDCPKLSTFESFFQSATGFSPYDYQVRLASGDGNKEKEESRLSHTTPCDSRLIDIPTGLGKTAAVPENEPAALGPFALTYLETLLRAADGRASRKALADQEVPER